MTFRFISVIFVAFSLFLAGGAVSFSLAQSAENSSFQATPRVVSPVLLKQGKALIGVWGIEDLSAGGAAAEERGRQALSDKIRGNVLTCTVRGRESGRVIARCLTPDKTDLGLFMIEHGFARADLRAVFDTSFENSYVSAQARAQKKGLGVWSGPKAASRAGGVSREFVVLVASVLGAVFLGVCALMSVLILNGFRKIIKTQSRQSDFYSREQLMKQKEREVVGQMVASEIKGNKAKIEAYITVYQETLTDLQNTQKNPKYKKLGDIIQKQPSLDRVIFDKNAGKLDILGEGLSSDVVHFYSRIKTEPDYENIEPDADLNTVVRTVQDVVDQAKKLHKAAEDLLGAFDRIDADAA